jgi:hypothetical protein
MTIPTPCAWRTTSPPACARWVNTNRPRQLDEDKLLVAVRPQFRVEVYGPAPDDPVLGRPSCAVPGCDRSGWEYGLCGGHSLRWRSRSRPEFVGFLATRARSCAGASG